MRHLPLQKNSEFGTVNANKRIVIFSKVPLCRNVLNNKFYEASSFLSGRTFQKNFLTSSTALSKEEHGEAPWAFVKAMGFSREQWDEHSKVRVLRAAVMTQFLREQASFESYWDDISAEFEHLINEIIHSAA